MSMSRRHHARRCGFTLIELVFAVGLLAIVLYLAGVLAWQQYGIIAEGRLRSAHLIQYEQATDQLRRDVWAADRVALGNRHLLVIYQGDTLTSWRWNPDRDTLQRNTNDNATPTQTWRLYQADLRFQTQNPGLRIILEPSPQGPALTTHLYPQWLYASHAP